MLLGLFGGWHAWLVLRNRTTLAPNERRYDVGTLALTRTLTLTRSRTLTRSLTRNRTLTLTRTRTRTRTRTLTLTLPLARYDVGLVANVRQVMGRDAALWLLPIEGAGPTVDGIHWPLSPDADKHARAARDTAPPPPVRPGGRHWWEF